MTGYIIISLIIGAIIYFVYIKPDTFKFRKIMPFLIVFAILIFLDIRFRTNNNNFYDYSFHSVVSKSNNYRKELTNYILNNDLTLYSIDSSYDIKIGDLIIKNSNTYEYKVYRKNEFGTYQFVHQYQYVP